VDTLPRQEVRMRLRSYFTAAAGIGVIVLSLTVTPARIAVAQMKTLTTEISWLL